MYAAYSLALAIALVLAAPWYLWKGRGTGRYVSSFRQRMGRPSVNPAGRPSIWIHAVSVGEAVTARALIQPLRERFPDLALLVSTTTLTGQAVAQKSLAEADGIFFSPFDLPGPVRRALDAVQPRLLVLVETEIWPNLIHEARRRGVRVAIVNGRLSESSFAGYRRVRGLLRRVLAEIDLFLMQGEEHGRRVRELGAAPERVRVLGNMKFDAVSAARATDEIARLFEPVTSHPLWVAGSTMPGEEPLLIDAFRQVRERVPDVALVMAPRHPERFGEVAALAEAAGLRCRRRTDLAAEGGPGPSVVVLDTMGELPQLYSLASVVFVGGSLVPTGGHNVLEPAVAGKAVVVGPHMQNFQEIAEQFRAAGGLVQVGSADELASTIVSLLTDAARRDTIGRRARELVLRNRGAVARTADALAGLLA